MGGGLRARRGPKSSLPGPAGRIKSGSCPVADLFQACADVLSSPQHHLHLQASPQSHFKKKKEKKNKAPLSSNSLLTPESKTQHSGDFLITRALARPLIVYLPPCVSYSAAIRLTVSEVSLRLSGRLRADLCALISEWPPLSPPLFTSSVSLFRQGNRGQEAAAVIRSNARFPAEIGNKHSGPWGLAGEALGFGGGLQRL